MLAFTGGWTMSIPLRVLQTKGNEQVWNMSQMVRAQRRFVEALAWFPPAPPSVRLMRPLEHIACLTPGPPVVILPLISSMELVHSRQSATPKQTGIRKIHQSDQ